MKQAVLYEVINKVTNNKYIGVTTIGLKQRWNVHFYRMKNGSLSKIFCEDFRLYGKDSFVIKEIERGDLDLMFSKEKELSKNKKEYSYNVVIGGKGSDVMKEINLIHTEKLKNDQEYRREFSQKASSRLIGHKVSDETRLKLSIAHKGKKMPQEFKQKRSLKYSGEGNPNVVYFLNQQNGIYYSSKDIENYFGRCIGHIRKMFREKNPLLNNFVKC